jgi:predicted nucleic acid-binding protein
VIVLDASVVVAWLLRLSAADPVEAYLADPSVDPHAPHLLDLEVAQVLRRLAAAGRISPRRGAQALDDLGDLDLVRHPHDVLLPSIWRLRSNLTAYDAAYVALAEALTAPLATLDAKLAAAPGHQAEVLLLS